MSYKDFDDWFFEFELYCMRCERFYDDVGMTRNDPERSAKQMTKWLRAAFEAGRDGPKA